MPALFIGHGSPMNAIARNSYTQWLNQLGQKIPSPRAILVISAHWLTQGTWITEMPQPRTIHDFYGFPEALFQIQYPAPGSPETAQSIRQQIDEPKIQGDFSHWGLDHGTWSILRHLYPQAQIPVLQLSIDLAQPPTYHVQLGKKLATLRDQGILLIGSGNLVHNLQALKWEQNAQAYDWALEYDEWLKEMLTQRDFKSVLLDFHQSEAGRLSIPSLEHYYPLHYILGAADAHESLKFEYEEIQNGSISMRSFSLGLN